MNQINLYDAKTNLSSRVDRAAADEGVIIAKNGVPLARLQAPYRFDGTGFLAGIQPRYQNHPRLWHGACLPFGIMA